MKKLGSDNHLKSDNGYLWVVTYPVADCYVCRLKIISPRLTPSSRATHVHLVFNKK